MAPAPQTYRRRAYLLEADLNDELLALEPQAGVCFGFNSVARDVWRELEQPRSFDQLRDKLVAEYDVSDEQCTTELQGLLDEMTTAKLIESVAN